ncbi:MAG: metalloregulator ArsR/SmtB family transcription factor [Magnetococcales bacterium]|nr:metalloregulator ArsR/SmtB family transcription factor [Magnetococcales bacterium]
MERLKDMIDPLVLFKALMDETRLRCLVLMVCEGELCVCELGYALGMIQPKISRHLALLRQSGMVQDRRRGHWVHYDIHPDLPPWAWTILRATAEGATAMEPFLDDRARLQTMADRPGRCANSGYEVQL